MFSHGALCPHGTCFKIVEVTASLESLGDLIKLGNLRLLTPKGNIYTYCCPILWRKQSFWIPGMPSRTAWTIATWAYISNTQPLWITHKHSGIWLTVWEVKWWWCDLEPTQGFIMCLGKRKQVRQSTEHWLCAHIILALPNTKFG